MKWRARRIEGYRDADSEAQTNAKDTEQAGHRMWYRIMWKFAGRGMRSNELTVSRSFEIQAETTHQTMVCTHCNSRTIWKESCL